jgi:hypothetical protein
VPPNGTEVDCGEISICTIGLIVTIAEAAFVGSASGVAVTTTEFGEGAIVGAV